jgi:glycosyltransferase involved in cell wall biosynthesis
MEKKNVTVSVAIAVFNEEKNLEECLSSVRRLADEIIIVDGGSSDKTVSIAKKFTSHIIRTNNPPIFHINKQKALDACSGEWILQLDADERVTPELINEIQNVMKSGKPDTNGYFIPRKNFFWGHFMQKGGQYPDYVMRLVRNGKAHFPAKNVHEQIEVDGKTARLTEPMEHISYRTKEDYWRKADSYIALTVDVMIRQHVPKTFSTWCMYSVWKPILTFVSIFIRHKGFVDGKYGFLFAYYSALHYPLSYRRYTHIQKWN